MSAQRSVNFYDIGDRVVMRAEFRARNQAGQLAPANPTTVQFIIRRVGDTAHNYSIGSDERVTNPSTGVFECWIEPTESGAWHWYAKGTGDAIGAEERKFIVRDSQVL
jgi:hypothetical protein